MLNRVYPKPDLTIVLDAPTAVLCARKPEGSVELVESRRQEYLQLREKLENFSVVNADQPLDEVTRAVTQVIREFYQSRNGVQK